MQAIDKILQKLIAKEVDRQQRTVNLIPSENYVSKELLAILGSPLTNKYSEGYPGKRYYGGNEIYDQIERLAQERLLKLFKLQPSSHPATQLSSWHVNVQPYSGSPANQAVYFGLMDQGDTLMGLGLTAGGHLTHGHKVNFSGRVYRSIQYGVDSQTGLIDYDAIERLAAEHRPRVLVSGYTAYPRPVDFARLATIAKKVGAFYVADISHEAGLIAAGVLPSPFPYADVVVTTTHKTLRGPRGAVIFCKEEYRERIDRAVFPGLQGGPHNNVIAAIAQMAFEAAQPEFKKYQKQILANAQALSEALKLLNPEPEQARYGAGFKLLTGGTGNHLMLIDLKPNGVSGREAQEMLEAGGIVTNRNSIPGDTSLFNPTGLRLGTPAVTTRGMREEEMRQIATWISRLLIDKEKPAKVKKEVEALCARFVLPY